MKKETNTNLIIRSFLAVALALAIWSPVQVRSAGPTDGKMIIGGTMMMGGQMMTETNMTQRCQAMKEQKEKMMADMEAQDAELTAQVAKMNSAPEDQKVGLMSAIVTHMVEQRIAMDARKAKMDDAMMQHMMQHMQAGKESMSQCPMMKGMKGMKGRGEKSGDAEEK